MSAPAVVGDVGFRTQHVGDLFLGTRRDGLVDLELGHARLIRPGNVRVRGMLVVERHRDPPVANIHSVCRCVAAAIAFG